MNDLALYLQLANLGGLLVGFFWIKPLRRAQQEVGQLKEKLGRANIEKLRVDMDRIEKNISDLKGNCGGCDSNIELQINRAVAAIDERNSAKRKPLHEEIGKLGMEIAALKTDMKNAAGWMEKLDDRLDDVSKGLANLAGQIERMGK